MNDPISKGAPSGSAWTAAAVLGFALVGVLKRPQLTAAGGVPAGRSASPPGAPAAKAGAAGGASDSGKPGTSGTATEHPPGFVGIARAVFDRFGNDNISLVAAGVAFYVMLSIFPALAALVSLYALVGNPDDVANRIQDYSYLLPPAALKLIIDGLHNFAKTAGSTLSWALATSLLLALWSARNGISSVMTGLNIAYEEVETRSFIVQTLMALGLTLGAILFAAVAVFAVAIIPIILNFLPFGSDFATLLNYARWPVLRGAGPRRGGRAGQGQNAKQEPPRGHHFSFMTMRTPASPAASRAQWKAAQGSLRSSARNIASASGRPARRAAYAAS